MAIFGFYAGYVASAFTFGRFVGSYPLGQVADSVGRKPVIIAGLLSIMVFSLAFGLSPTFGFAITTRLILGLTNGIALSLRTTMREVCGEEHILQGMTYLTGGKAVSIVLGTGIGGLLAQPVLNFPTIFSSEGILGKYPFLLPNLIGACGGLVLLPLVIIYVPETKELESPPAGGNSSRRGNNYRRGTTKKYSPEGTPGYGAINGVSNDAASVALACQPVADGSGTEQLSQQSAGMPTSELKETNGGIGDGYATNGKTETGVWGPDGLLAVPRVKMVLLLVCVVQAVLIGFDEAYPLWTLSTPDVGGLGWGPVEIGKVFLTAGLVGAVLQLVLFPRAVKALGLTKWQRLGCILAVPAFIAVPCSKGLSWNESSLFFASAAGTSLVYCFMDMVNLSLCVASTSMVRSNMRAKMAGLYNMAESLGRFIGPAGFATMFAWSIAPSSYDWVDYHFIFLLAALSMAVVAVLAWGTITHEHMMTSAGRKVAADIPVAGSDGNARTPAEGFANPAERLI